MLPTDWTTFDTVGFSVTTIMSNSPFSSICDQSRVVIFSFLDFKSALRLYATGSMLLRDPILRKHIGNIDREDVPFLKKRIDHLQFADVTLQRDSWHGLDAFRHVSILTVLESRHLRSLRISMNIDFGSIFKILPVMLEKITLIDSVEKTSYFSRFEQLSSLTLPAFAMYDCPLPSSLKYLLIGKIDDRTVSDEDPIPPASERINLRVFIPGLMHLECESEQIDCVNMPETLRSVNVQTVRDPENLAKYCPSLERLNVSFIKYAKLKMPKSLTHTSYCYYGNDQDPDREKVEDHRAVFGDMYVDLEGGDLTDLCRELNVSAFTGQHSSVDLTPFEGVKSLTLRRNNHSDMTISSITDVEKFFSIPRITSFPSTITILQIMTPLIAMSVLQTLPVCIEKVAITSTFIHDRCDLTDKTCLRELFIFSTETPVQFKHSIRLPRSLRSYSSFHAIMGNSDMPLPKLETLRISFDKNFDLKKLPSTIKNLSVRGCSLEATYNPIDGFNWDYTKISPPREGTVHFSGLVYMSERRIRV